MKINLTGNGGLVPLPTRIVPGFDRGLLPVGSSCRTADMSSTTCPRPPYITELPVIGSSTRQRTRTAGTGGGSITSWNAHWCARQFSVTGVSVRKFRRELSMRECIP